MADVPSWVPWLLTAIVLSILEWRRRAKAAPHPPTTHTELPSPTIEIRSEPDHPIGFGRKNRWIAVPASSPSAVAEALELREVQACNWRSGFVAAYAYPSDYVFVTPPLDGLVLAVGIGLPDPGDPAALARWRELMRALSKSFTTARYFATHRVSNYTAWALYSDGVEQRLFAHADERIHDLGEPTPEESGILDRLPDPAAAEDDPAYWERDDIRPPDEEDVLALAAAWSLDPSDLESRHDPPSVGLVGRLPARSPIE